MTLNNNNKSNSVLPPEVLHKIYKSLDPKQRFSEIPTVCSNWNKACQSQSFPIEVDLSVHFSILERYFYQNSLRTSPIELCNSLNTIATLPSEKTLYNEEEIETIYGKCKTEIKYQPILYKKIKNGNTMKITTVDNTKFEVKDLLQDGLKKKWNSLSHGRDSPNRNLIPILKNIRFLVESPALWFDSTKCDYFLPVLHDIFHSLSPYAPERIDIGLVSLPVLYQIPVNIKHLTLCLLMSDYSEALEYICHHFTHLESLDLTIKSNQVFTPELNEMIKQQKSSILSTHKTMNAISITINNSNTNSNSYNDRSNTRMILPHRIAMNDEINSNDIFTHQYNMSYFSTNTNDILIDPENFRDLIKLTHLHKFSIHNPVRQIANVKTMYYILSTAKSLKELSFSPRLLLTRVDDQHLISMIHSLVRLSHLDFENPYIELWNLIKTCFNITELSLNYTHSYLTSLVRESLSSTATTTNTIMGSSATTTSTIENDHSLPMSMNGNFNRDIDTFNRHTDTSIALATSPTTRENRFNELFHTRLNRNRNLITHTTSTTTNNQNQQESKIIDDYFEKSVHGFASCFPNLEKLQISWQATSFSSPHDYTISVQKVVETMVYLKRHTSLKSITLLHRDPKLVTKLEKALGKTIEIKVYQ